MTKPSLKILQINLNRSSIATESALQLAIELNIDLILVQEPWIIDTRSTIHPAFFQILPNYLLETRPRTLAYIANRLQPIVTISPISPTDPDLLIIDIITGTLKIQVYNIYNEKDQLGLGPSTIERCLYPISIIFFRDSKTPQPFDWTLLQSLKNLKFTYFLCY